MPRPKKILYNTNPIEFTNKLIDELYNVKETFFNLLHESPMIRFRYDLGGGNHMNRVIIFLPHMYVSYAYASLPSSDWVTAPTYAGITFMNGLTAATRFRELEVEDFDYYIVDDVNFTSDFIGHFIDQYYYDRKTRTWNGWGYNTNPFPFSPNLYNVNSLELLFFYWQKTETIYNKSPWGNIDAYIKEQSLISETETEDPTLGTLGQMAGFVFNAQAYVAYFGKIAFDVPQYFAIHKDLTLESQCYKNGCVALYNVLNGDPYETNQSEGFLGDWIELTKFSVVVYPIITNASFGADGVMEENIEAAKMNIQSVGNFLNTYTWNEYIQETIRSVELMKQNPTFGPVFKTKIGTPPSESEGFIIWLAKMVRLSKKIITWTQVLQMSAIALSSVTYFFRFIPREPFIINTRPVVINT